MTKVLRNFWLDLALVLLLVLNITLFALPGSFRTPTHISLIGHLHAIAGSLLALGCLVHIGVHWQWFRAVLTGKAKGRIKLVMNSLVAIAMVLAVMSGQVAVGFIAAGRPHSLIGYFVVAGLLVHSVKHARWMASVAKRLVTGRRLIDVQQSA